MSRLSDLQKHWANNNTAERSIEPHGEGASPGEPTSVLRYALATALGVIAAAVILFGAVMVFVGIYATWAYQDDPSSAQNLILVPFGLVVAAPGWFVAYLAYRVARK